MDVVPFGILKQINFDPESWIDAPPWGLAAPASGAAGLGLGIVAYLGKLATGGFLLALFETSIAKMRVFRVPEYLGAALMLGLLATLLLFASRSF